MSPRVDWIMGKLHTKSEGGKVGTLNKSYEGTDIVAYRGAVRPGKLSPR